MAFSAATCLTDIGNAPLQDPMFFYSDKDNFVIPFTSTTLSQITGVSCPCVLTNIPNGTKIIRIISSNNYGVDLSLESDNICKVCNMEFQNYNAINLVPGKLSVGNVSNSCQPSLTDYLINWYGPNNPNRLAFTSGIGSSGNYSYDYTHPMTNTNVVPTLDGNYIPVIQSVKVNDRWFGVTGNTGVIPANLSCLKSTIVLPCNCGNNTNTTLISQYNHFFEVDKTGNKIPAPTRVALQLSGNTKFVPWRIDGLERPDRVTIYFSGSGYTDVIGLEDYVIGTDISSNNFSQSVLPKSGNTSYFNKITTLSGLTVFANDKLIFEITTYNPVVSWKLYFTCLSNYNCNDCLTTPNYKILKNVLTGYTKSCNQVILTSLPLSGCSKQQYDNNTFRLYNENPYSTYSNVEPNTSGIVNPKNSPDDMQLHWNKIFCSNSAVTFTQNCIQLSNSVTISVNTLNNGRKVLGFSGSPSMVSSYYNEYLNFVQNYSGSTTTNNNNLDYYRYAILKLPNNTSSFCNSNFSGIPFFVHTSSPFRTGTTSGTQWLQITANTISSGTSFNSCFFNCVNSINSYVSSINQFATGFTYTTYTSPFGAIYNKLISGVSLVTSASTTNTAQTFYGYYTTYDDFFRTLPFSGNSNTFLPNLSGTTCSKFLTSGLTTSQYSTTFRQHYVYAYKIQLTNPTNVEDFDVYADTLVDEKPTNTFNNLVLRWSGKTFSNINNNYVI